MPRSRRPLIAILLCSTLVTAAPGLLAGPAAAEEFTAEAPSEINIVPTPEYIGIQFRAFSTPPGFQQLLRLLLDGFLDSDRPVFSPPGGIFGATIMDGLLYTSELDNGGSDWFLGTVPYTGGTSGQGSRVGSDPIGYPDVEGITAYHDTLLGISIDFPNHVTTLIDIHQGTGIGTGIGNTSFNVILEGIAWDQRNDLVYGVGVPFGDGPSAVNEYNLYMIDPATGQETLIGETGMDLRSLTWHPSAGLIGGFGSVYTIDRDTAEITMLGDGVFDEGVSGNGFYALAAIIDEPVKICGDPSGDGTVRASDALTILKAAVGIDPDQCGLECDVDSSGALKSSDALAALRHAVNSEVEILCPIR